MWVDAAAARWESGSSGRKMSDSGKSSLRTPGHQRQVFPGARVCGAARLGNACRFRQVVIPAKRPAGPMRFMLQGSGCVRPQNDFDVQPRSSSADCLCAGELATLPRRLEKSLFVLPPRGEIQTFPGANLDLCVAFLPNLCLTAPSCPPSHGALPGGARGRRLRAVSCAHAHRYSPQKSGGSAEKKGCENLTPRVCKKFSEVSPPSLPSIRTFLPFASFLGPE